MVDYGIVGVEIENVKKPVNKEHLGHFIHLQQSCTHMNVQILNFFKNPYRYTVGYEVYRTFCSIVLSSINATFVPVRLDV